MKKKESQKQGRSLSKSEYQETKALIHANIGYKYISKTKGIDKALLDEFIENMLDMFFNDTTTIKGVKMHHEIVKNKVMKISQNEMEWMLSQFEIQSKKKNQLRM